MNRRALALAALALLALAGRAEAQVCFGGVVPQNDANNYWFVTDSSPGSQVYNGATGQFVALTDGTYVLWTQNGCAATTVDTLGHLQTSINNRDAVPNFSLTGINYNSFIMTGNVTLNNFVGDVNHMTSFGIFNANPGLSITLAPQGTTVSPAWGFPYFFSNPGAQDIAVKNPDGSAITNSSTLISGGAMVVTPLFGGYYGVSFAKVALTGQASDLLGSFPASVFPAFTAGGFLTGTGSTGSPSVTVITGLVKGNGSSAPSAYAGTSCTNQFPRSLNASGAATCASVANADLVNSTITLNAGASVGLSAPGTMSLGSTYTVGAITDNVRLGQLGLGMAATGRLDASGYVSSLASTNAPSTGQGIAMVGGATPNLECFDFGASSYLACVLLGSSFDLKPSGSSSSGVTVSANLLKPDTDNATTLGDSTHAWSTAYALNLALRGSSSGTLTVKAAAAAGSNTLTLPAGTTDLSATGGSGQFVKQTSSGGALTVAAILASELPGSFAGFANPTALAGLAAVNGSAATAMRSDAAPALDQSITPTWTGGPHTWSITRSIASATAASLDDVGVASTTTTITGNTGSPITRLAKVGIYRPALTDSSPVTVTDAASLYVDNSPQALGSVTITNAWAILVANGNVKFNGSANNVGTITTGTWNGSVIGSSYGGAGTVSGALKANGSGTVSQAACADLSNGSTGCAMSTTAGGDLSGTLPSPTVAKANGISMPSSVTQGGIPWYPTTNSQASSALLTQGGIVYGGGGGAAPAAVQITGLVLGNGSSAPSAYGGTGSCTNQFIRAISALGASTCNTVQNADLANSTITLNVGSNVGLTSPGAMTLGSTYTIGSTSDKVQLGALGLGVAAPGTSGMYAATGAANSIDMMVLKRNTDSSPAGNFMRLQTAAASDLFTIDVSGNVTTTGQQVFNIARTVASSAGAALDDVKVSAATTTVSGVTTITRLAKVGLYQPTLGSGAVTITDAATLYVDNPPVAIGSTTISNAWALLIGAGATKLQATTINAALTYGGVTLSSAVTGTGAMVLATSPTITTPTITTSAVLPLFGPPSDSTTAVKITKANLSTAVVTVDTTNARVGINKTPGAFDLDVNGAVNHASTTTLGGALTYGGVTLSNSVTGTGSMVLSAGPTFTGTVLLGGLASITAHLGGDVTMTPLSTFVDGPQIAQGTSGTWWVSGTVSIASATVNDDIICKLWDGTTSIASTGFQVTGNAGIATASLSGFITSPAANLRISCGDFSTNNVAKIKQSDGVANTASTISAFRIN